MGFFKKKATGSDIAEELFGFLTIVMFKPIEEFPPLTYLLENTKLSEMEARYEIFTYGAAIFDFVVRSKVSSRHHEAIFHDFYDKIKEALRETRGEEAFQTHFIPRLEFYKEAIPKKKLPGGTPAIARVFLEVCEGKEGESIDDYNGFNKQATLLFSFFFDLATKKIKQYKIV